MKEYKEKTITTTDFDKAVSRALDVMLASCKEAGLSQKDVMRGGLLVALVCAEIKRSIFKPEEIDVKEDSKDGN